MVVAYPDHLPITVPNLLAFMLAHSGARLRWRIALALCSLQCMTINIDSARAEHGII
jgi:hypothetical protein